MGVVQVRKTDRGFSECCKEMTDAMSESTGENYIKVKIYCRGCLKILKVFMRQIRERQQP